MVTVWRLVKERYADSAFDGEGARLYGGPWNSPGTRVAYGSDSIALAILEVLVHLQSSAVLPSYRLVSAEFDEELVRPLDAARLPPNWRESPPPPEVQAIGDEWVASRTSLVLHVPSAIVDSQPNYLINVDHPDFHRVRVADVGPFLPRPTPPGWIGRAREVAACKLAMNLVVS